MNRTTKIGAGVAAGAAALLAATAIAAAASPRTSDDTTPSPSTSSAPQGSSDSQGSTTPDQGSTEQARPKETPLTGTDAEKATAAAEAAVDGGTVIRVETDNDGVYEAHVRKSDGTEVVVKMDKDFTVTAVEEFQGRGGRGGHGGGRGGGAGETPLTGTDAEKATAAAEAAVDGGTVIRVETDNDGVYEAHVRKSDGTEVVVKMDKDFTVTAVEEFQGRGGHDGADDDSSSSSSSALPAPSTSA